MRQEMSVKNASYIKGISGIRAISILSILFYHINPSLIPGGFVGVDFFFVISGFVVSLTMAEYRGQQLGPFILGFYRRRITRVVPALLLFVLLALFLSNTLMPSSFLLSNSNKTGLLALIGMSNIFLWQSAGDYFAPTSEYNFFTHTWSLATEEQFYLIYPVIGFMIISVTSHPARRSIGLSILFALALVSIAACALLTKSANNFAFYMLVTRFWELAAGAVLYHMKFRALKVQNGAPWAVLMLFLLTASFFAPVYLSFPFPAAIPAVLTAALLIHTCMNCPDSLTSRSLSIQPIAYIGDISYSLYLWHWFFVVLARWTVGLDTAPIMILVLILSIGAAVISFHGVENPVRRASFVKRAGALSFFTTFSVVLIFSLGASYFSSVALGKLGLKLSATNNTDIWYPYVDGGIAPHTNGCDVKVTKDSLAIGQRIEMTPQACSKPSLEKIFVIGDSHAEAYSRMMYMLATQNRRITIFTLHDCNAFRFMNYGRAPSPECIKAARTLVADLAQNTEPQDVLFLPALRVSRYRGADHGKIYELSDLPNTQDTESADLSNLSERVADLAPLIGRGVRVIVEGPKPVVRSSTFLCADWYTKEKRYCQELKDIPKGEMLERIKYGEFLTARAVALIPNSVLWEPFAILCPGDSCGAFMNGKPLFFDGDHLSGYGNDILFPSFDSLLRNLKSSPEPSASRPN